MRVAATTLLLVITGFLAAACGGGGASSGPTSFRTEAVTKGTLQVTVLASGTTVFPNVSKLTFGSSGTVAELGVRVGQAVTKGRVLARLDTSPLETQVLQARQSLLNAQKALQDYLDSFSEVETARLKAGLESAKAAVAAAEETLADAKEVSEQELAQADTAVANARLNVQKTGDALEQAKVISPKQMADAEAAVANAKLNMKKAQEALETAKKPFDDNEISKARDSVESGKANVRNAQLSLDNAGNDMLSSQLDWDAKLIDIKLQVVNAEEAYKTKFSSRYRFQPDVNKSPWENLYLAPGTLLSSPDVETAWDTLVKTRGQQASLKIQATNAQSTVQNNLLKAREALDTSKRAQADAESRLQEMLQPGDPVEVGAKEKSVAVTQATLSEAMETLEKLKNGPDPLDVQVKDKALAVARANLKDAEKQLAKLKAGPDPVTVQQKASALETAKANLLKAMSDLGKQLKGPDPGVFESRKLAMQTAETGLKEAEERLKAAVLAAPFDGVVSTVNVEKGLHVSANAVAVVVVDTSSVEVNASVDEVDVTRLQVGQEAVITLDALSGVSLRGGVATIAPTARVQQGVVSYDINLEVLGPSRDGDRTQARQPSDSASTNRPNTPGGSRGQHEAPTGGPQTPTLLLRDGMTASARIIVSKRENVLLVPLRAVRTVSGQRVVEVLENGKPVQHQVQVGQSNDQFYEVVSGLNEGEMVVIPTGTTSTSQGQRPFGGPRPGGVIPGGGH